MTKARNIRKLVLKSFTVLVIAIQFLLIFNFTSKLPVSAQSGRCGGVNGLVNWKSCLNVGNNSSTPSADKFFINSGYTDFYISKYNSNIPTSYCNGFSGNCDHSEYALNLTVAKVVSDVVSLVLFLMLGIFLFLVFKAVFIYVTAGDSDDKIQESKKTFSTASKGLLIVAVGFIVIGVVGSLLGLGNFWEIKLFV